MLVEIYSIKQFKHVSFPELIEISKEISKVIITSLPSFLVTRRNAVRGFVRPRDRPRFRNAFEKVVLRT